MDGGEDEAGSAVDSWLLGPVKGIIVFRLLLQMLRILHIKSKRRKLPRSDSRLSSLCSFEYAALAGSALEAKTQPLPFVGG